LFPGKDRNFFLFHHVQATSWPWWSGSSFPRVKVAGCKLIARLRMSGAFIIIIIIITCIYFLFLYVCTLYNNADFEIIGH
jgi:hypothetical protein